MEFQTQIYINAVLRWSADQDRLERILWIDPSTREAWCIDLTKPLTVWPTSYPLQVLEQLIQIGDVIIDPNADPYTELKSRELSTFSKKSQKQMEKFWPTFSKCIQDKRIFDDRARSSVLKEICNELGIEPKTARKYLRRFMELGFSQRGLAQFTSSGGRGERRHTAKDGRRLGRSRRTDLESKSGIAITPAIEAKFETSLFTFKRYTSKTKRKNGIAEVRPTITDEYNYMLNLHFAEHLVHREQFDGEVKLEPLSFDHIPTERQYRSWRNRYLQNQELKKAIDQNRLGSRHVGSNMSAHIGSINDMALTVGMYDVIDATPLDLYVRSSANRNVVVGRPTLYVVMDAFSGYIKNVFLTFEGESYATIATVLADTYISKKRKCALHGIEIDDDDWLTFIGRFLLTDHGVGYICKDSNNITILGISLATTPAFRPDNKGIIESNLKTFKIEVVQKLYGAIFHDNPADTKYKDELLKSRYNYDEIMTILISFVLDYNQNHPRMNFPVSPEMFSDGIQPYPDDIVRWSVKKNGALRQELTETVLGALLPKDVALVTSKGIIYDVDGAKLRYETDDEALHSLLYIQGPSRSVKIARHPSVANTIFICADLSQGFKQTIPCHLINSADMDLYRNVSFAEVGAIAAKLATNKVEQAAREQSRRLINMQRITAKNIEVEKSYQETRHLADPTTETQISENREAEKRRLRQTSLPVPTVPKSPSPVAPPSTGRGITNPELQAENARKIKEIWDKKGQTHDD